MIARNCAPEKVANSGFRFQRPCAQIQDLVLYHRYRGNFQFHSYIQDILKLSNLQLVLSKCHQKAVTIVAISFVITGFVFVVQTFPFYFHSLSMKTNLSLPALHNIESFPGSSSAFI
jgi:hypothetical protein